MRPENQGNLRSNGRLLARLGAVALLLVGVLGAPAARAQEESAEPAPERLDRTTPRGAVAGYLEAGRRGDFEQAASYLNLAPVPRTQRETAGPRLARDLLLVLDRVLWVDLESLSVEPRGRSDDGLPARRDRVGSIDTERGPVEIFVDRVQREGVWTWEISPTTVARIPALTEAYGYGPLADVLPDIFFESQLLGVQLWQWLGLLVLVLLAYFVSWLLARMLLGVVRPLVARSSTDIDDRLLVAVAGPLQLVLALLIFRLGLYPLGLALTAQRFFVNLEKVLAVVAVTWFLTRLVEIFGGVVEQRMTREGRDAATLVPLGRKTLKTVIVLLALLAALDSFGVDITAIIAGLGVGGLAVALGAQKTLENLFGGATLIADRPVQVGDFCRFGDQVGVVEEIGMRSTRIRTLARTLITVPNAEFASLQLENFAKRDKIWFNPRIGLRYETSPEQMRYVLVKIRETLYAHPKVEPDPARIRFVGFGDCSLDLDIFAYIRVTDFGEYLEVAEDLNLRLMDVVAEAGTGFAFPSSTTYLARDDGVDAEKTRRAETAVEGWRAAGELPLPGFPQDRIRSLADSIAYPPEGSALRDG